MGRRRTERVLVARRRGEELGRAPDELVVEEPLEIRLDGAQVTTTMRTPGDDFELAAGLCFTDGLLGGVDIRHIAYCGERSAAESDFNVVDVDTGGRAPPPAPRLAPTTSSCGWCGSASIDVLVDRLAPLSGGTVFDLGVLAGVPARVRSEQALFDRTGASHAAAAFTSDGEPVVIREDVGRHNAVDKVVGRLLLDGRLPATGLGLFVSGRASFEMVAKAWAGGFPAVVAVSAPTALALATARTAGLVLAGFVRDERMTLYAPPP
ncbi:MAG TPA: formate dehydrogenase accessory sulfurtransferase FdhD [Acidimicrobiales bacterium]|nr:formate dehydrogenase accessory sulfurtransferase FdhD [Acidimicrobiales bacterium]